MKLSIKHFSVAVLVGLSLGIAANIVSAKNADLELYAAPSSNYKIEVKGDNSENLSICAKIAERYLDEFAVMTPTLKNVVIHTDQSLRRGLSNESIIYLRCLPDHNEFLNVLIHEIGHVVDLGYLEGTKSSNNTSFDDFGTVVKVNDPSYSFYSISWKNNTELNKRVTPAGFVSTYGSTDPFEDFAESFMLYVRYNDIFKELASNNPLLEKKYSFIEKVFEEAGLKELVLNETNSLNAEDVLLVSDFLKQNSVYDATQIHKNFLVYL
jgi:hypothetical protein